MALSLRFKLKHLSTMTWTNQRFIREFENVVYATFGKSNYSLASICNAMHLSRSQLHRRIKTCTGLSATQYIRKIRMRHAASLLSENHTKIIEVSEIVGIKNVQNFSRYFKCEFGISPSQFRSTSSASI